MNTLLPARTSRLLRLPDSQPVLPPADHRSRRNLSDRRVFDRASFYFEEPRRHGID
jgi:hypothetical protein